MVFRGEKLKHLMEVMGWSFEKVAEMTGLNAGHIHDLVHKTSNPRKETVAKICKGLHIAEQYFYIEDSMLPIDVIPDMPEEVKKFIANGSNVPWLVLTERAKREGLSIEDVEKIIDLLKTKKS